jgi:hypothetical protein
MKPPRGHVHRARIRKLETPFPLPARPPATACCDSPHTGQEAPGTRNTQSLGNTQSFRNTQSLRNIQSLGPALDEVAPSHEVALRASLPPPAAASAPSLAPACLFSVARSPEALRSEGGPTAGAPTPPTVADSHRLDTTEKAAGPRETACLRFSDERRADRREPAGFALKVLRA